MSAENTLYPNLTCRIKFCPLCGTFNDTIKELYLLNPSHGWAYCDTCRARSIEGIINYFDAKLIVPIPIIKREMVFYRARTDTITYVIIPAHFPAAMFKNNSWIVMVHFYFDGIALERGVSLRNLLFHNDWLWEFITTAELRKGINFKDLPEKLRENIESELDAAKKSPDGKFPF